MTILCTYWQRSRIDQFIYTRVCVCYGHWIVQFQEHYNASPFRQLSKYLFVKCFRFCLWFPYTFYYRFERIERYLFTFSRLQRITYKILDETSWLYICMYVLIRTFLETNYCSFETTRRVFTVYWAKMYFYSNGTFKTLFLFFSKSPHLIVFEKNREKLYQK